MNVQKKNKIILLSYLLLIMSALFWSGNFFVGRIAGNLSIPPISLNFYRWILALLILLPFTYKKLLINKYLVKKNILKISILGITGITFFNSIVYYSLNHTYVINAVLMISIIPVVIVLLSWIFFGDKISIKQIIGIHLSIFGVFLIITKGLDHAILNNLEFNKGDLWMLVAVVSWATYSVILKKLPKDMPPDVLLVSITFCGLFFLFPGYIFEFFTKDALKFTFINSSIILYVALFAGILAFYCWNKAVSIVGPNISGLFLHLMPVFSSFLAVIFLGEIFVIHHILGVVFIISGILLTTYKNIFNQT